jgi:uncharacterized protein YbjT (DUF2867 family)
MPGTFPHKAREIQPMKVGVSGASGQLGSATLRHLREGLPVAQLVGVSRTPDKIATGIEARFGDFAKPESLQRATGGFDVITGDIERLAGRKPCSLSEFAAAAFTAARS